MRKITYRTVVSLLIISLCITFSIPAMSNADTAQNTAATSRLAGIDRYQTAVEVSKKGWPNGSESLILAYGGNFPDALSAAPLAKKLNAPILLTGTNDINNNTTSEITRLGVKQVYIIGGTGVISSGVADKLTAMGITATRIAGNDRYETSARLAEQIGTATEAFIVTGADFPDALSVAAIAAKKGMPILLVAKTSLPDAIKSYIASQGITKTFVVGSSDIIANSVVSQLPNPVMIYGSDKYERNVNIINQFASDLDFSNVFIATGENFPDALAGSALAPNTSSPIILVKASSNYSTNKLLNDKASAIKNKQVLGGTGVVSESTLRKLGDLSAKYTPETVAGRWYTPKNQTDFANAVDAYSEVDGVFVGHRYKDVDDPNSYVTIYAADMTTIAATKYPYRYNAFSNGLCAVTDTLTWDSHGNAQAGRYGFIDPAGNEVIPCMYSYATDFKYGLSVASKTVGSETMTLVINKKNETVLSFKKSELDRDGVTVRPNYILANGIYYDLQGKEISAEGRKNTSDAYGYWDENGARMNTDYDGPYHDNYGYEYAVYNKTEVDAFINSYQTSYSDIQDVGNGFFIVTSKGKKGVVDQHNKIIVPIQYRMIDARYTETDTYFVTNYDYDDNKALYSSTGKKLLDGTKFNRYAYAGHNAIYYYKWDNKGWGIISLTGETIAPYGKYRRIFGGFYSGTQRAFYDSATEPSPILFMFYSTANMQVKADTTSLKAAIATCNNLVKDLKAAGKYSGLGEQLNAKITKANALANSKNPTWIDVNTEEVVLMDYAHFVADTIKNSSLDVIKQKVEDRVKEAIENAEKLRRKAEEDLKKKLNQ